jgi:hypothetical protein
MAKIIAPEAGHVYHGVYPGGASGDEADVTQAHLDEYLKAVGQKRVAWVYFSHEWSKSRAFPAKQVDWIHRSGAAPFIRLMVRSSSDPFVCEPCYTLKAIASGRFDGDLKAWGESAALAGIPLICEWGTEMNGMWFSWNAVHNGGAAGASLFQDAFRRVVGAIREGGGKHITWVFHVNHENSPDAGWNQLEKYDPGPDFADWVGVSLYGAQLPSDTQWPVFSERMEDVYKRLEKLPGGRPIMVCELGFTYTKGHAPAADPVAWAKDALGGLLSGRWPLIRGFSWWNEGWPNDPPPPTEMRVQAIPGMGSLFRAQLKNNPRVVDVPIEGGHEGGKARR